MLKEDRAGVSPNQRSGLPRNHPARKIVTEYRKKELRKHEAENKPETRALLRYVQESASELKGSPLTYPGLLFLEDSFAQRAAAAKGHLIRLSIMASVPRSRDEATQVFQELDHTPPGKLYRYFAGRLGLQKSSGYEPHQDGIWEDGFRAGIAFGDAKKKFPASDRRGKRTELFWLTYKAWRTLEECPAAKKRVRNLSNLSQLISILAELGVEQADNGDLSWRTEKGEITTRTEKQFANNLSRWMKDFPHLAQMRK